MRWLLAIVQEDGLLLGELQFQHGRGQRRAPLQRLDDAHRAHHEREVLTKQTEHRVMTELTSIPVFVA